MKQKVKVLGISASLRNARRSKGNIALIDTLGSIETEDKLHDFLKQEAAEHLNNFNEAGRKNHTPFDEMYRNLRRLKGDKGLSNSEVALAAALWSAKQLGADIGHLSLSEYFLENGTTKNLDELKEKVSEADAIVISSPVYFGDRSSLVQSFINLLKSDPYLRESIKGKVYGGIAVGAKRNGGQETTLIYQLMDMIGCGFLGVGNDSETTSQYGGTGHAGDIGTMPADSYGLNTAMGAGRRIARVASMLKQGSRHQLNGKHHLLFWVLQDKEEIAYNYVQKLISDSQITDRLDAKILGLHSKNITRCLACDICPTHVDIDEEYRCVIKGAKDDMPHLHEEFLNADAIIPVAFSPKNREGLRSTYQTFMERTRYLRRGDYVLSDIVTAPIVIEDVGSGEDLAIRMTTSMIRHHTVISDPMIAYRYNDNIINHGEIVSQFCNFNEQVRSVTKGKVLVYSNGINHLKYKPVGYVLSTAKDFEDEKLQKRAQMVNRRIQKIQAQKAERISS